jgi:hypothetical protein
MEEARNAIRRALNVPTTARAADTIRAYAKRAKNKTAQDMRQIDQNKSVLRVALTKAGYAIDHYNARVESSQDDDNERRTAQ